MTDSSDYESDAGASPSVSSDDSSNSASSRSSSPETRPVSKPVVNINTPPRKRGSGTNNTPTPSSILLNTPPSSGRKPLRKRQILKGVVGVEGKSNGSSSKAGVVVTPPAASDNKNVSVNSTPVRKRKRSSQNGMSKEEDLETSADRKRKRNKRRRTRSERNLLAGKTPSTPVSKSQVVAEGEEAVALDAEIDRVLEEKAIKNNLSATNVKSIIRHVITNNMVQKMIMSAMRKKAEAADAGGSSEDDGLLEPKMTRAKTKELMGNKQISLWPIVDSPVKMKKHPMSETHMLIQHDLPEDSSGDEEYVPKENDAHSDDESSVASVASDVGSPAVPRQRNGVSTRRSLQGSPDKSPFNDPLFKTPPPRPKTAKKSKEEEASGISRRTRSKHPLTDTPLEDLERQFIPPDVTTDMYDWGTETDNEDYLAFLQEFLNPGLLNQNDANENDDEADPEYNVMEDDEDLHDREELRRDRAVKVPKKELTQLIAELFEPGMLSGDEFEDHDLASLTGFTPLVNDSGYSEDGKGISSAPTAADGSLQNASLLSQNDRSVANSSLNSQAANISVENLVLVTLNDPGENAPGLQGIKVASVQDQSSSSFYAPMIVKDGVANDSLVDHPAQVNLVESSKPDSIKTELIDPEYEEPSLMTLGKLFTESDLNFLRHQIRQHIQLLAQSYVLTCTSEDTGLKQIAKTAKTMIIEIRNHVMLYGPTSCFSVCNMWDAYSLVNTWPFKALQQSPIKKKILEEKYISESGISSEQDKPSIIFPRHVVKIIAESPVFIYNNLLPEVFDQKNNQVRRISSNAEDCLLVGALEDFKNEEGSGRHFTARQQADVLSQLWLPVYTPSQLYNRIRNLKKKKTKYNYYNSPALRDYFIDGKLPRVDRTVPELTAANLQPLIKRDRSNLSRLWRCLLQHLEELSSFNWDSTLKQTLDSKPRKYTSKRTKKPSTSENEKPKPKPKPREKIKTIDRVFPQGTLELDKPQPDMENITLYDSHGRAGAVIKIPKYAIESLPPPGGMSVRLMLAGSHISQPSQYQSSVCPNEADEAPTTSKLNIIGLNHLIRRSQATELQTSITSAADIKCEENVEEKREEQNAFSITSPVEAIVEAVGMPFDLPELNSLKNKGPLDISTLESPMKRKIMETVTSQTMEVEEDKDRVGSDGESSNGIEESSGEEEPVSEEGEVFFEDELRSPEVITLSDNEDRIQSAPGNIVENGEQQKKDENNSQTNSDGGGQKPGSSSVSDPVNSSSVTSSSVPPSIPLRNADGDDSDEEKERKPNLGKRGLPKDFDGDESSKDEDSNPNVLEHEGAHENVRQETEAPVVSSSSSFSHSNGTTKRPPSSPPIQHQAMSSNGPKSHKKAKRSPGNQCANRRVSKYNVAPAEQMLEDDPGEFDDVADAYMEAYLGRVQAATEAHNPGIFNSFVQLLMEAGDKPINQKELHAKVKVLFKDYPELLVEFESFLDPSLDSPQENRVTPGPSASVGGDPMAVIMFEQKLEQFTEKAPQLKAKIMNKFKSMADANPAVTEKELASAIEPFFLGNPVMMTYFKDLFPSVYRPQSMSKGMDFEVLELDMEDPPKDEDQKFEIVKLPEETTVPATNTCPCVCHTKTSDPAFASRSKHCRKCSLKFQDGKIFIHNGRVMRPVSVELTPASSKQGPVPSCSNLNHSAANPGSFEPRSRKDSSGSGHYQTKARDSKGPESNSRLQEKKPSQVTPLPQHSPHLTQQPTVSPTITNLPSAGSHPPSKPSSSSKTTDGGTKADRGNQNEDVGSSKSTNKNSDAGCNSGTEKSSSPGMKMEEEWTEEEDTIILTACQEEPSLRVAYRKMAAKIPHKSMEEIRSRCSELIALIQSGEQEGGE